jgi:hypothetical protein
MTATGAYDAQNRLKTVERLTGTTVAQTKTMTYDTLGSTSTTFSYGAGRERFRQVNGFASNETTIYVDGLFDRSVVGTTVTNLHYILAFGQAVAVFSSRSDGVTSTRYLHRDHLGSVTHCVFRRSRATIPIDVGPSFRGMPGRCEAVGELSSLWWVSSTSLGS